MGSDADMDTSYVCYFSESVVNSDNCISENVSVCIKRLSVYKHMVKEKWGCVILVMIMIM